MPTPQPPKWSREPFDLRARYPYDFDEADVPSWVRPLISAHGLHPVIHKMLDKHEPTSWREVLHQWPHISMKDPTRVAYTPNEAYAKNKRVMVTTPGKYLAKHWPHISSHLLRDATLLSTPMPETMYLVHTTPEMVIGVEYGPTSCMVSTSSWCQHRFKNEDDGFARLPDYCASPLTAREPNWDLHPFAAYRPEDGWHMALRKDEDGIIMGRALCLTFKGNKCFVRSYKRAADDSDGYSHTDEKLNAWLMDQGYEFISTWPEGAVLRFDNGCAPYLDGGYQNVERYSEGRYKIEECGSLALTCTDGDTETPDNDDDDSYSCDNCGDSFYEGHYVGRDEGRHICESCFEDSYTEVRGRDRSETYWVQRDDASPVQGTDIYIDDDWVPDDVIWVDSQDAFMMRDDVVCLVNGEYAPVEDAECCTDDSEWRLREDCWQDDETELWYSMDEPFVEQPDGKLYHQDTVDQMKKVDQPELALEHL